ncbi:MAG: hypothetical protein WC736_15265 [Gallionella sp.]|jgi:hypothetical protein
MNWFESYHCLSGSHCAQCRNLESGRTFRADIYPDNPDFLCPHGREWGSTGTPQESLPELLKQIAAVSDMTEHGLVLRSMVAQCQDTLQRADITPCVAHRQTLKIRKYWQEYQQATKAGKS